MKWKNECYILDEEVNKPVLKINMTCMTAMHAPVALTYSGRSCHHRLSHPLQLSPVSFFLIFHNAGHLSLLLPLSLTDPQTPCHFWVTWALSPSHSSSLSYLRGGSLPDQLDYHSPPVFCTSLISYSHHGPRADFRPCHVGPLGVSDTTRSCVGSFGLGVYDLLDFLVGMTVPSANLQLGFRDSHLDENTTQYVPMIT
jgi:hypothetical protein